MKTISCIITSAATEHNLPLLKRCIRSLRESASRRVRIYIIVTTENNHHILGTIAKKIDMITLVKPHGGFVRMNNEAMRRSLKSLKSDYHLIINDDAWVEKNFFDEFMKMLQSSQPEIVAPLIFEGDSKIFDSFGVEYFKSGYSKNSPSYDVETTLASGSCMFIKSSFLSKMKSVYGFFLNPILVWYLDDVDFSIRALAIGGKITKNAKLIAYHLRTFTWGRKSDVVMFHTYRNILWVIILTWPLKTILLQLPSILFVQCWVIFYSTINFGPFAYAHTIIATLAHLHKLTAQRKTILSSYSPSFRFNSVFSKYTFRSRYGFTV